MIEIHVIPYSHNDFAWCNTRQWHEDRYTRSLVEVLDLMRQDDQVTWVVDNVLHALTPFLKNCPERLDEFRKRVAEGRIDLANGGMSLARPNYVGDETFVRNMVEATRFYGRELGASNVPVFFNADVACGHSQLPQILSLGGHKYYYFWRPGEALDHKGIPRQFVWEGLDGARIIASRGGYLGFTDSAQFLKMDLEERWDEARRCFIETEIEDRLRLLPTGIVWAGCGCDDFSLLRTRLSEPVDIPGFVREWNLREHVPMVFSTPDRYFRRLEREQLPLHKGLLDPCELSLNAPLKGDRSLWRMRQELDRLIVDAETLSVMASLAGGQYPENDLRALWAGLFEITGHAIEWVFEDDADRLYLNAKAVGSKARFLIEGACEAIAGQLSFRTGESAVQFLVKDAYVSDAESALIGSADAPDSPVGAAGREASAGPVWPLCTGDSSWNAVGRAGSSATLASSAPVESAESTQAECLAAPSSPETSADQGVHYVVLNVLNWARTEQVKLHITDPFGIVGFSIYDAEGSELGCQIIHRYLRWNPYPGCDSNAVDVLVSVEVPACGYTTLKVTRQARQAGGGDRVEERQSTNTVSVPAEAPAAAPGLPQRSGPCTPPGIPLNTIRFVQTKPENTGVFFSWEETEEWRFEPEDWRLEEDGSLRWVWVSSGHVGAHAVRQAVTFYRDEPVARFRVDLDCREADGYFIADFPADPDAAIWADIPFGVEARDVSGELYGWTGKEGNNFGNIYERGGDGQFFARSWVQFKSGGRPMAIVSENCSIYYRDDRVRNRVSLLLHRLIPLRSKRLAPEDEWAMNCHPSMAGTGVHNFSFVLYYPEDDHSFADLARFSRQIAHPLHVVRRYGEAQRRGAQASRGTPSSHSFVTTSQPNVVISAFYREREDLILRVFEAEGRPTRAELSFSFDFEVARLADFLGNTLDTGSIEVDTPSRKLVLDLRPWQIASIRMVTH